MADDYLINYQCGDIDKEMMLSIVNDNATGRTIFDVGAYIGASSLVFSKLVGDDGRVIAFEPNPYNLSRMKKNLRKNNRYEKRILICPFALSDNNNITNMLLSEEVDNGHSSTSRIFGAHPTISDDSLPEEFFEMEVENKKLDDYVLESKIIPDIIKVDIEGAEHMMLAGAVGTLKKYKPVLYIEIHSGYCAIKCYEILKKCGYSVEIINEEDDGRIMIKSVPGVRLIKYRIFTKVKEMLRRMLNE